MKTWSIPAKTFLLGEYAALADLGAMIITTNPCFELSLSSSPGLHGIHPDSPAGLFWEQTQCSDAGLFWHDPFENRGGMGASTAQFLGAYWAACYLENKTPSRTHMLEAYWQFAWSGRGLKPSGYDLIAQSLSACVYLNRSHQQCESFLWNFTDLDFILVHTGHKLPTHHHLLETILPNDVLKLDAIVTLAKQAFTQSNSLDLVSAVNAYYQALLDMELVCLTTQKLVASLKLHPGVLAAKGCGAMGADVVLLLISPNHTRAIAQALLEMKLKILATTSLIKIT
jgi:mevalonate kinase